jgi:hypothetical protein
MKQRLLTEVETENNDINEMQNLFDGSLNESFNGFSDQEQPFIRPKGIPKFLRYSQPKEGQLSNTITKKIQKEFSEFNDKLVSRAMKVKKKIFNLPKKVRVAIKELKTLVQEKKIDIRKVDKGQLILVIDYAERKKIEEKNISDIAVICEDQSSNWTKNREFVDKEMKKLYHSKFIAREELIAVTGLLPGGADGKLKTNSGGVKFTRATDSNELFAQQRTPYVYPLLKAHKLSLSDLQKVKPDEVHEKIPARLVVGMASCQLMRVQSWLEHLLTPFSKEIGLFEYTKDSNSVLQCIEKVNQKADREHWNLNKATLFAIDVKALYPSVKLPLLRDALIGSFKKWTSVGQEGGCEAGVHAMHQIFEDEETHGIIQCLQHH